MRKMILSLAFFGFYNLAIGQTLNVREGISSSSLNWNTGIGSPNKTIISHSLFVGLDYFQTQFFNLSSNIGIIRKGGSSTNTFTDFAGQYLYTTTEKATLDYLSFNTTLDLRPATKKPILPFLSVGPRIDYLIANSDQFSNLEKAKKLNKVSFGMTVGCGLKYRFSKVHIGLRTDYLLNFNNISEYSSLNQEYKISDKTFLVHFILGYNLK